MNSKTINLAALLFLNILFAQKVSTSQAINMVGKQCMLSQRIANSKVFLSGQKKFNYIAAKATPSIIQFEQSLTMLNKMDVNANIYGKIKTNEMLWMAYKQIILDTNHKSNNGLLEYSEIMLKACKKTQEELYKIAEEKNEFPYNTGNEYFTDAYMSSNDIKYFSQRLSFLYNLYYYKFYKFNKDEIYNIIEKVDAKIILISKMRSDNFILGEKIDSLEYEWKNLKTYFYNVIKNGEINDTDSPKPEVITKNSNQVLINADLLIRELKSTAEIDS